MLPVAWLKDHMPAVTFGTFAGACLATAISKILLHGIASNIGFALGLLLFWLSLLLLTMPLFEQHQIADGGHRRATATPLFSVGLLLQLSLPPVWGISIASILFLAALIYLVWPLYANGLMNPGASAPAAAPAPTSQRSKALRFFYVLLKSAVIFLLLVLALSAVIVVVAKVQQANPQPLSEVSTS